MGLSPSPVQCVTGSGIAAAVPQIQSLAQELPHAAGAALKKKKKKKKKRRVVFAFNISVP